MNIFEHAVQDTTDNWWEDQLKYQRKEPGIINSQLLIQVVFDQGPKDYAGILAREEGIDFVDVTTLRISFKNILKIANLWNFTNVVKLQLDNNSISKIEGLDHMIHLKWLDLSFNVITRIENLNNLVNLRDLTLYHNQVTVLENMDQLINLEVFSIGKNNLKNIENVIYLRTFKSLKSVNFSGNPITEAAEYRLLIIAYLPQLQYIDYSVITNEQRDSAAAMYENLITTLEAKDEVLQSELALLNKDTERLAYYKKSFVDGFSGETFVDLLFQDDDDDAKLKLWWMIQNLFNDFRANLLEITKDLFFFGLAEHEEREKELQNFRDSANFIIKDNTEKSRDYVENFLEYKRKQWSEFEFLQKDLFMPKKEEYNKTLDDLFSDLVNNEILLVENLDDLIQQLELNLNEMIADFKSHVHTKMSSIRELAGNFYDAMIGEANNLCEKKRKPDEFDEIPSEIMHLAGDKMLLTVTIQTSHDQRLAKMDNIQDDIYTRLKTYVPAIIDELHDKMEVKRNRARIQEICHFVDHHRNDGNHIFDVMMLE